MKKMDSNMVIVLAIFVCCTNSILSCNINICFTWTLKENELKLVCKVEKLNLGVEFIDPYKHVKGSCLLPFPHSICTSKDSHVKIWQNLSRNETILLYTNAGEQQHGNWTCLHGSRKDAATIQVNIHFPKSGCLLQLEWWTVIGFLPSLIATRLIFAFVSYVRRRCYSDSISTEERANKCIRTLLNKLLICYWAKKKKPYSICIAVICIVIIMFAFGLPFLVIKEDSDCKGEHGFICVGITCGALISLMMMMVNVKGKSDNSNTAECTQVNQESETNNLNENEEEEEEDEDQNTVSLP